MKGDRVVVRLVNGGTEYMEVSVGGRRLTVEEPGPKETFYVIREHAGSRISQRMLVHKDQMALMLLSISEDDYTYKET